MAYDAGLTAEDRFYVVVPGGQATLALKGTAAIDRDLTLGLATFTVTGGTALVAGTTGGVIDQSKDARLTLDLADPGRMPDGKITAQELAGDPAGVFANLAVDGAVRTVLPLHPVDRHAAHDASGDRALLDRSGQRQFAGASSANAGPGRPT